ncbi:fatty-acid amide hydrolase 2 [Amyelois transitella]|uniref:fatty-acid amide hydrolase 2 n=1 Tax=Amyelois transitella TaxID=680683 RepID=UPI00067D7287|nr:fatty-acid amide hydrolase 2 [Amyelois transitella]
MALSKIIVFIRTYIDMFIDFVFGLYWEGKRRPIPDLEKKHRFLSDSAVSLAAKIRNRELKSEELVNACIERIKIVNPIINAVTDERFEDALKEAREIDLQIAGGLPKDYFEGRPFLGVPFTVKECTAVQGMLITIGLISRRHTRADEDSECVRLLRQAGAIPLAVTNVPEGLLWQESRNMLYGQTKNPYHTGRTTGGSSGGEGALCAALGSPISLCSDLGGSTRMPAMYCGLYALNPTAGHTNLKGLAMRTGKEPTMGAIGFVSKHCEDLAPLTKIVAGDKARELNLDRRVDVKNIKVYYVESTQDPLVSPISAELRQTMKKAITTLSDVSSHPPKQYYHEGFNHMFTLWKYWMTKEPEKFRWFVKNNREEANGWVELAKKLVGQSEHTISAILKVLDDQIMPVADAKWAESMTSDTKNDIVRTLGADGVLLFPSVSHVAPYHYSLLLRPYQASHWSVFNALQLPSAQVPLGLNKDGIPLGIQVVAAPKQESLCLAVADYLGKQIGGYVPPCKINQ